VVGAGTDELLAEELRAARASEARLGEKLAAVETENSRLQSERRIGKAEAGSRDDELRAEVEARDGRIVDLEARKAAAEAELEQASAEISTLRARAADADKLTADHASVQADRDRVAGELERLKANASDTSEREAEVQRLEGTLSERAEHIRKLEADLEEAERIGKELIKELAHEIAAREGATPSDTGDKLEQLSAMASENARLRADVQALEWTVQELENRLDHATRRTPDMVSAERPGTEAEKPQGEADAAR
jgi:DNA repair exonuclease SbcCD ATPase subunit